MGNVGKKDYTITVEQKGDGKMTKKMNPEACPEVCVKDDDTLTLVRTIAKLQNGDTLQLQPRTYHFYPETAFEDSVPADDNYVGSVPCLVLFNDRKRITIDGNGAELIFHGGMIPFCFRNCEDVTIRNLTVDYASPFFAQAEILEADEKSAILRFDSAETQCAVKNRELIFYSDSDDWQVAVDRVLALEYNPITKAPEVNQPTYFACFGKEQKSNCFAHLNRYLKASRNEDGNIRLTGDFGFSHTPGNRWLCIFDTNQYHAMVLTDSRNITVEDVTLHHAPSKGIFSRNCENLTVSGLRVVMRKNSRRLLTLDAEALYCDNCRGTVSVLDSVIENTMSNGIAIRGSYGDVYKKLDSHTLVVLHEKGCRCFRPKDSIRLFDAEGTRCVSLTVKEAAAISERYTCVSFEEILPEAVSAGDLLENSSAYPDVTVENCQVGNNRPYGVVIASTGKIRIHNCTLYGMFAGLVLGFRGIPERECGAIHDAIISGNRFFNSAFAGGYPIRVLTEELQNERKEPCHRNISICGNTFQLPDRRFLAASSVENLVFRDNRYCEDKSLRAAYEEGAKDFYLKNCGITEMEEPISEKDGMGQWVSA